MFEFNLNLTLQIQLEKITNTYAHPVILKKLNLVQPVCKDMSCYALLRYDIYCIYCS